MRTQTFTTFYLTHRIDERTMSSFDSPPQNSEVRTIEIGQEVCFHIASEFVSHKLCGLSVRCVAARQYVDRITVFGGIENF